MQRDRIGMMQQQVNQGMGSDNDLAARMARIHIPPSISSEAFSDVPPPPPRTTRILTLRDLDFMIPEQLNLEMLSRGLQSDQHLSKHQRILLILRHDTDHRTGITQPVLPKTSPPKAPPAADATAVEHRPVPQGGLTLSVLRDYSDDEIDAELRDLGINHPANLRRHAKINMILYRCAPSHSETDMQRGQDNLDMLRRSQFGSSYAVQSEEVKSSFKSCQHPLEWKLNK